MKIVIEKDEIYNGETLELIKASLDAYNTWLKGVDSGSKITKINIYVSAQTSDDRIICGSRGLGNTWLVKPGDFIPLTPTGKISTSKKYKNEVSFKDEDGKCLAKIYYSTDPNQIGYFIGE